MKNLFSYLFVQSGLKGNAFARHFLSGIPSPLTVQRNVFVCSIAHYLTTGI